MAADTAVLLLSHRLCDTTLARLDELRAALPPARYDLVLLLTEPMGRAAAGLGIPDWIVLGRAELYPPFYEGKGRSARLLPHDLDLPFLAFWRMRPGYRRIWLVEYDVYFPDGGEVLARLDAASDASLIIPLRVHERSGPEDGWIHWTSIAPPGPPEPAMDPAAMIHSLQMIARYDHALLSELDALYRAGWAGNYEALVPSLARARGLPTETLIEVGRRAYGRQIITARSCRVRDMQPEPRALIFHPVKTEPVAAQLRADLAAARAG